MDSAFVFSGFLVGLLVGVTGVGGGSLLPPLLILVFGVAPVAAATNRRHGHRACNTTHLGRRHWLHYVRAGGLGLTL